MKFTRNHEDITVQGQTIRVNELSIAEFEQVTAVSEADSLVELLWLCLEPQPASKDEIPTWPASIVNQLASSAMAINGLADQGN
tara:strand:- start:390 stop:641 length:252 start_codon:yes stop_codon:yes gene_type:complete